MLPQSLRPRSMRSLTLHLLCLAGLLTPPALAVDVGGVVPIEEEAPSDTDAGADELIDEEQAPADLMWLASDPSLGGSATPLVGLVWKGAPRGGLGATQPDTLDGLRALMERGNPEGALALAERLVRTLSGRDAAAAWLLIGMIHRDAGRHNLASEAFTEVRTRGGPLASWGAWYEAEQDLTRGRTKVALGECRTYLQLYPTGPHAEDCEQLIAIALARLGEADLALAAASRWDAAHPVGRIGEQVRLALAAALGPSAPDAAIAMLRELTVQFAAPLTTRRAERALASLRRQGHASATAPSDVPSLQRRAISLRDSGSIEQAWTLYTELARRGAESPELARWADDSLYSFASRTRHWTALYERYERAYSEYPSGDVAWNGYRAAAKGGDYAGVRRWVRRGLTQHPTHGSWRGQGELIGRTLLLAGDYALAVGQFDAAAARGGQTGRMNALYAGFASWKAGQRDDAIRRFTAIIDAGVGLGTEARYWRAKARGAGPEADADRAWIRSNAPESWYALLLREVDPDAPRTRDGQWPAQAPDGAPPPEPPATAAVPVGPIAIDLRRAEAPLSLAWPPVQPYAPGVAAWGLPAAPLVSVGAAPPPLDPRTPPPSYPEGPHFQRATAVALFDGVLARHASRWPDLAAVRDLARVGLYDLSGPLMNRVYVDWYTALRRRDVGARELSKDVDTAGWRQLFALSRDHHHTARHAYGLRTDPTQPEAALSTARLKLPLAHDHDVWRQSSRSGLDPYLVLGLMQTESVFDARAVSRVGARGPMQIMPRTGHLLADLAEDEGFTAATLHDPIVAVDYGIAYLGLLMERFGGVYPLAVASYNGGPHNVSVWLAGTGHALPIDEWVEHIPFAETRRYVRLVTERYARYAKIYEAHAEVAIPPHPTLDDASVVNF
jgi:tetratricopeptide (TPR) repeat protein